MPNIKAVLCGYYGQDNGGDEALLVTLLQMLPPQVTPIVLSAQPEMTADRYGVRAVPHRDLGAIARALRQSQWFIWGGGSLMQDRTSWASPLYYGGLMAWAQAWGLGTVAWGQGLGPFQRPWVQGLTRQLLARCRGVGVRDLGSAALLADWGIEHQIAPDPVWCLQGETLPRPRSGDRPLVGVNLRPDRALTAERLAILGTALGQFQRETDCDLLLLPFQDRQDRPVLASLLPYLLPDRHEIYHQSDPRRLRGVFAHLNYFIGMRLHSLIMACAAGCPAMALSYDPKVSQLQAQLGLPGYAIAAIPPASTLAAAWIADYRQPAPGDRGDRLRQEAQANQTALEQWLT